MGKVTGKKMTEDEKANKKVWYCQTCGGELDEKQESDPTRSIKCSGCGDSWWATDEPEADDVKERMTARKAESERQAAREAKRAKAAK